MSDIVNIFSEKDRNIIGDDSTPTLDLANSSTGLTLSLHKDVASSATIAVMRINASTASGPAFEFAGSCVQSTCSGTASLIAGIRAQWKNDAGTIVQGWIPLMHKIS